MKAEIITIGDEILIGQIVDTNSTYISSHLEAVGIDVRRKYSIADNHEDILAALGESSRRAELIVVTGGLGPTKDDITKQAFADFFSCTMVRNQQAYQAVQEYCEHRGLPFNELNESQADIPQCAEAIRNNHGTAPGMWFDRDGVIIVSLPGVPFEMKEMMGEVIARLKERFTLPDIVHKTAITFGIGESRLAKLIESWEDDLPSWLKLAYLPNPRGVRLRLSSYNHPQHFAQQEIERRFELLRPIVGAAFVGFNEETVYSAVADMLTRRGETLSIAESCTGGYLSSMFTSASGASAFFNGSVVSYSNRVKTDVLGVDSKDIEQHGAVSSQVVAQMAEGVRRVMNTHYAMAVSGIAGPTGGTADKPVGTVWIAIATEHQTQTKLLNLGTLRGINIELASSNVADMLRLYLLGL